MDIAAWSAPLSAGLVVALFLWILTSVSRGNKEVQKNLQTSFSQASLEIRTELKAVKEEAQACQLDIAKNYATKADLGRAASELWARVDKHGDQLDDHQCRLVRGGL